MYRLLFSGALALTALLATTSVAFAASYGSFTSATGTVTYNSVSDLNGLFGTPTASGNSLDFNPMMFEAMCDATTPLCPPTDTVVADTLDFEIAAHAGNFIQDIMLNESGDTFLGVFGSLSANTTVVGDVTINVIDINGVAATSTVSTTASMIFTSSGVYDSDVIGGGAHLWNGMLAVDVNALIAGAGLSGMATRVEVSLENTLTAYADSGASSRIEKKDIGGLAITVIPEPGPALLMGLGLAGLASVGTRRRA